MFIVAFLCLTMMLCHYCIEKHACCINTNIQVERDLLGLLSVYDTLWHSHQRQLCFFLLYLSNFSMTCHMPSSQLWFGRHIVFFIASSVKIYKMGQIPKSLISCQTHFARSSRQRCQEKPNAYRPLRRWEMEHGKFWGRVWPTNCLFPPFSLLPLSRLIWAPPSLLLWWRSSRALSPT